jgi:hypothetical protein
VTRNLTGAAAHDYVTVTPNMRILQAGWWNVLDWNWAQAGMSLVGQRVSGTDIEGNQCIGIKGDMMRWVNSGLNISLMVNSVVYNTFTKYRAQDNIQIT